MYISSDTNIWIDFSTIEALELPFKLDHRYVMSSDALTDELLSPKSIRTDLLALGLMPIDLDDQELTLVYEYIDKYNRLSVYDTFAMAIAKTRNYILLTGDGNLRKAAISEQIVVKGTLWILDEIYTNNMMSSTDYLKYLKRIQTYNGRKIRLPATEIQKRIDMLIK